MEATTGWTEGKRWEMSLVLVDRDLHVENDVQLAPLRRFPMWIRYRHDRAPLLRELGLASLCDVRADQCHLWRNNVVIDEQSSSPLHISDGDYIKVFVGDMDQQDSRILAFRILAPRGVMIPTHLLVLWTLRIMAFFNDHSIN